MGGVRAVSQRGFRCHGPALWLGDPRFEPRRDNAARNDLGFCMRHGPVKVSRGAETLALLLVALTCTGHSTAPPSGGGGPPGTQDWTYVSNKGGLQPAGTVACPAPAAF